MPPKYNPNAIKDAFGQPIYEDDPRYPDVINAQTEHLKKLDEKFGSTPQQSLQDVATPTIQPNPLSAYTPPSIISTEDVAKKILLDLNELDRLKKIVEKDKDEINQLNTKIKLLENTNNLLIEKDSLSSQIIKGNEEKFQIVEKENEDLRKTVKKIKQKNIIVESVAGTIVAALTYILVFK